MLNFRSKPSGLKNILGCSKIGLPIGLHSQFSKLQKFKYSLPQLLIQPTAYITHLRTHTKLLEYFQLKVLQRIYSSLHHEQVQWLNIPDKQWIKRSWQIEDGIKQDQFYCYRTMMNLKTLKQTHKAEQHPEEPLQLFLRINDFPEQPLYTIVYDDVELLHVNDVPKNWKMKNQFKEKSR